VAVLTAGILFAVVAACQAAATVAPASEAASRAISVCPESGEFPPQNVTDQAVAILTDRLHRIGVEDAAISVSSCIDITSNAAGSLTGDDLAALLGTGLVELVPVPPDQAGQVLAGSPAPVELEPILAGDDLAGATIAAAPGGAQPTLDIQLTPAANATLARWSREHVGEELAFVVDGQVVETLAVREPITNGRLAIQPATAGTRLSVQTIAALIGSGPLPEGWAQPELPQG